MNLTQYFMDSLDSRNCKANKVKENLKKANKTLDTMAQGYSKYASLAGKILHLNTFVLSTIWNSAWIIDIKDEHYKKFIQKIKNYLHWYKGKDIMEHVSKHNKSCQKPTIELAGRLEEKLNISPLDIGHK